MEYINTLTKPQYLCKLTEFCVCLREEDIVMISDSKYSNIMIGKVIRRPIKGETNAYRTCKVEWLTQTPVRTLALNSNLLPILKKLDNSFYIKPEYIHYVNQAAFPIYIFDMQCFANIPILKDAPISVLDYKNIFDMLDFLQIIATGITEIDFYASDKISVQINVQSPGWLALRGPVIAILLIALFTTGGEISYGKFKLKTNSIAKPFCEVLNTTTDCAIRILETLNKVDPNFVNNLRLQIQKDVCKQVQETINIKNHPAVSKKDME